MKTIKNLKSLLEYRQTDEVFKDYLSQLVTADVITINDGDFVGSKVSDDFYTRLAAVFGIQLDDDLNPIKREDEE